MKLSDLHEQIKEHERQLAPGSETAMLGDWLERMRVVAGELPDDVGEWDTIEIPDDEAQWWLRAYAIMTEHDGDEEWDLHRIYDSIQLPPSDK